MINLIIFWLLGCTFNTIANIEGFNKHITGVPFMFLIASSWYGLYLRIQIWRNYSKLGLEAPVSRSIADAKAAISTSAFMLEEQEAGSYER